MLNIIVWYTLLVLQVDVSVFSQRKKEFVGKIVNYKAFEGIQIY